MPLSDYYPSMKGATPVVAPTIVPAPPTSSDSPIGPSQSPVGEPPSSPYLRTSIPLPFQYAPDSLKQYNRPGLSSFRIAPLPPSGNAAANSAATSVVTNNTQTIISSAAGGPNSAVQFNNGGALAGAAQFEWDNVSSILNIIGSLTISNPLGIISGGTGTSAPALVAGSDITITGSFPDQTVSVKVQAGVVPASYTNVSLTVDGSGIITAISSGTVFVSPMTTLGDIIYENATPSPARLPGNITTVKEYLSQTGTGAISAPPVWSQIAAADLSNGTTGTGALVLATAPTVTTPTWTAYTVSGLPAGSEGQYAYATDGRKVGEGVGTGTGVPVYFSNALWRVFSNDSQVLA